MLSPIRRQSRRDRLGGSPDDKISYSSTYQIMRTGEYMALCLTGHIAQRGIGPNGAALESFGTCNSLPVMSDNGDTMEGR